MRVVCAIFSDSKDMMFRMQAPTHMRGFSLIELSVVLIIISLLVGVVATVGQMQIEQSKYVAAKQTLANVQLALDTYYEKHKELPCPAVPATAPSVATYGFEAAAACVPAGCTAGLTCPNANVIIGALPYKTLGLGEEYASDEWGNKILYIVDRNFTPAANTAIYGNVIIQDQGGNQVLRSTSGGDALYALVSAGKNESGGWPKEGGARQTCVAGQRDNENCDDDAIVMDIPVNDGTNTTANIFDDIVVWKTQESTDHFVYVP
jgi:prepilin-type N-terminal cleavage/methylation domain-containing protein